MNDLAIEFKDVTKSYFITRMKFGTLSGDLSHLLQRVFLGREKTIQREKLLALSKVNFKVKKGQTLGIIGKNGSGKSTILKLISKITYPNSGQINVNGRTGAFIELGAGLHPELSGRENIFLYGAILGMKKKEINEKYGDIVKFSGIEKFIDTPIKHYSSGMYARLGFSVVSFMNPDILLIDEVLAVGDNEFRKKCLAKMHSFAKGGKTIVFVSHDLEAVKSICTEVIFLERGKIVMRGEAKQAINTYLARTKGENLN